MEHRPTRTDRTARIQQARNEGWVMSAYREIIRLVTARAGYEELEIAGEVALELYSRGDEALAALVAANPDPLKWARQRVRHACIQHDRDERVQRCQGSRLVRTTDDTMRPQRSIVWGNAPVRGKEGEALGEQFDTLRLGTASFEDDLVDHLDAADTVRSCTRGIGRRELAEVLRVDGDGDGVADVATSCGQQRETVSRRVNATRATIRKNADQQADQRKGDDA